MNVLVYSGPETLQLSLNHVLASLRYLLVPNYTVQPITQHALVTQPWQTSCALLVLPRCSERFVSVATKQIKEFVEGGGAYLMLGTDATATPRSQAGFSFGATGLSLGLEAASENPLKLYDKLSNCYITTDVENRTDPRGVDLLSADGTEAKGIYDTEAAQFKGFDDLKAASILARYSTEGSEGSIASLLLGVNQGHAAFWGPSIECPLTEAPALSTVSSLTPEEIATSEKARQKIFAITLTQLGLKVPEKNQSITRPLPQFLTSAPNKPDIVAKILDAIAAPQSGAQLTKFKDSNDEFYFHRFDESAELLKTTRESAKISSDPSTWQPKHIVACRDGILPGQEFTPMFDLNLFYTALFAARTKPGPTAYNNSWGMGEAVIYGEAVTSTQTMLDKNPRFLTQLPVPLLSIASHQLAGRGRGSNVWLSPSGCLQFSLTLRVSLDRFPAGKLVFVQYLFSLAAVEACRDESVLGSIAGDQVRIKWPNDLYAFTGPASNDVRKIGGVLVNTSFSGGKVDIVIGCGLNILNPPPITSLSQLQPDARAKLSMERSAAAIIAKFEQMWNVFIQGSGSFAPFNDLYLERWLHSDQVVTLTTTTPHTRVRIAGITPDYGLLRTVPERSGMSTYPAKDDDYIDLQPDGNSFDLMANLIKSKS